MQRLRSGDASALRELMSTHESRIRRMVRIRLHARSEDLVRELDLEREAAREWPCLQSLAENGDEVAAWLDRLTHSIVAQLAPGAHPDPLRGHVAETTPASSGPRPDTPTIPYELAWRERVRQVLDESMIRLPPAHREVILLRDYCGGSWSFLGRRLGSASEAASRKRWMRAWTRLRQLAGPGLGGIL